jgi:hypothetical protein
VLWRIQQEFITRAATAVLEVLDPAALVMELGARTRMAFTQPDLPAGSQLARADQLLHQHWGCGFAALRAVLSTAADWPTDSSGIASVTAEELVREASAWSALPEAELTSAVDRLRLHPGNAVGTGAHAYTDVERRTRLS